ncbi:MAG: SDR family oxidoreductase [Ancrocorticia sp.]|nr:SDR family oxidoreductase [Ancrocorticia sp.]
MNSLRGQRILITGGSRGIGRAMAVEAARRGGAVVVWNRKSAEGQAVVEQIRAFGGQAEAYAVDVSDKAAVKDAAARTGAVDIVVNGAGVVSGKRLLELSEEQIERTYGVNVMALYWVTRAFLPEMIERRRGVVVTMASAAGLVGVARQTDYSASKFAAFGFAESLRHELAQEAPGVKSLVVCPYYVDTGMFNGVRTRFAKILPILQPEDVARKVLDAIEAGKEQLILPPFVRVTPVARALPVRVFDAVVDFLGINHSMDSFTGHSADGVAGGA